MDGSGLEEPGLLDLGTLLWQHVRETRTNPTSIVTPKKHLCIPLPLHKLLNLYPTAFSKQF
jgi:hypothetical protein